MTDQDVVRRFHQKVGFGRLTGPYHRRFHGKPAKPIWHWTVTSFEKVQALIAQWWPWLGSRRRARATEVLLAKRTAPVKPAHRTQCPQGHPYSTENTKWNNQKRSCRECQRRKARVHQRAIRAGLRLRAVKGGVADVSQLPLMETST
jgi:hypothetical protein